MKLDLRYRPQKFAQVLGNDGVKRLLLTRSQSHTLTEQSMMFGGPKGCGKTTLARLVARAIMCHEPCQDGEPCGNCAACLAVSSETHPNVEELDAASQGTVDKIRSMVREADYETSDGRRPVYILDEAQRLSASAQDALLKAIEDRSIIIILCTTEPHKIREPIRSRVEEYPIQPPGLLEIVQRMQEVCQHESIRYENDALDLIAYMQQGCPRSCLMAIDSLATIGDVTIRSAKQFFRFDSFELVTRILIALDANPSSAMELLDQLAIRETASWIKYHLMLAITSGLREAVGAKPTFPLYVKLPSSDWSGLLRTLGSVERPVMTDIEAVLLCKNICSFPISIPTDPIAPPQQIHPIPTEPALFSLPSVPIGQKPPAPISKPAENIPKSKTMEIDGVKFSTDENLTSLDDKIKMTEKKIDGEGEPFTPVKLDKEHVPLTEKQFVGAFLEKIRKNQKAQN